MRALALLLNIITIAAALAVTVWLVPGVNYTGPNKLLVDESFDPAIALGVVAIAFMLVNSRRPNCAHSRRTDQLPDAGPVFFLREYRDPVVGCGDHQCCQYLGYYLYY